MSKLGIIIKREYLRRVSAKSFIILTVALPFIMAAIVIIPLWMSQIKSGETKTVAVIDATGKYRQLFSDTESYIFISSDKSLDDYRNSPDKSLFAILNITSDLLVNPKAATIYSEKQVPQELSRLVNQTIRTQLEEEKLASFNIPNIKEIIEDSKVNFDVQTVKMEAGGKETASSTAVAQIVGFASTIIIYMFVIMYGAMVMNGVLEEKTNRIVEIMVSSVKPFELMMGKIIGIAFVGFTQIFIWIVMMVGIVVGAQFFMLGGIDAAAIQQQAAGSAMQAQAMNVNVQEMGAMENLMLTLSTINFTEIAVFFIIYFIGGYLLYASLFAAIGSAVNQQEDTQQFVMPITMLSVFSLYVGIYSIENPDGPMAFWCSMIPITSPIVMMMRLPFDVPLWEKLLSVVILMATSVSLVWLAGKIYRVGILMYGKKPSFKEMIKWIRYK